MTDKHGRPSLAEKKRGPSNRSWLDASCTVADNVFGQFL
jgi:hypothetical protein